MQINVRTISRCPLRVPRPTSQAASPSPPTPLPAHHNSLLLPALKSHMESRSRFYLTSGLLHPICYCFMQQFFIFYCRMWHSIAFLNTPHTISLTSICFYKSLREHRSSILLVICLEMEVLDHRGGIGLVTINITKAVFEVTASIYSPLAGCAQHMASMKCRLVALFNHRHPFRLSSLSTKSFQPPEHLESVSQVFCSC